MKPLIITALFITALCQCFTLNAQDTPDSTEIYRIETADGNIFTGYVVSEDEKTLVLNTENLGEIKIPQNQIKSKTILTQVNRVGSEIWLPNPQSARYFWAPNGYGLEKGSASYQNIWILYNQFSVGVTSNFSIGAGMLPLFLFAGTATPVWIVPKFSIPVVKDKFNVATGALLGTFIGESSEAFGLLYGTTTFGSRDKNFSAGIAYGFAGDEWMKTPVINISGMYRISRRGYLITENYVFTGGDNTVVLISAGGRSIIRNVGIDYSLWIPFYGDMDDLIAIPFLGITVPIGRKK